MTTLDSGVRVVTERIPAVRSVALGFLMDTGSTAEREDQAGISHLLEHMLFRGTERYGSEEIDQIFDEMGAEINAGTDKESTTLYTRVLDGHLERAFDVMADMIWRPRFGELEAEREVVLEEIAMYEDDPQDRVFEEIGRAVFDGHPLARPVIGTAEAVAAVTRERLAAYHAARYTPESIVIAAAGLDRPRGAGRHGPGGGAEPAGRPVRRPRPDGAPPSGHARSSRRGACSCAKTPSSSTSASADAGIARDDERRFALRVLEGILGGTSSSRLFQEVRERRGLAYSVFSYSNQYAHTGEIGLYVGTRPENLAEALEVLAARAAPLRARPRRRAGADPLAREPQGPHRARPRVDRGADGTPRRRRAGRACRCSRPTR